MSNIELRLVTKDSIQEKLPKDLSTIKAIRTTYKSSMKPVVWDSLFKYYPLLANNYFKNDSFILTGESSDYTMNWSSFRGKQVVWNLELHVKNGSGTFHFDLKYGWLSARRLLLNNRLKDLWGTVGLLDVCHTLFYVELRRILFPTFEYLPDRGSLCAAQLYSVVSPEKLATLVLKNKPIDSKELRIKIREFVAMLSPLQKELRKLKPTDEILRLPKEQ